MATPSLKRICILGESPLVEEYAALCLDKALGVRARLNAGSDKSAMPGRVKKITKPTGGIDVALELTNTDPGAKKANLVQLDKAMARGVIISSSLTVSVAEQSTWIRKPARLIGLGALPTLLGGQLIEFAPSALTDDATKKTAVQLATLLGKEYAMVQDTVGLVLPRILCMLANEACFAMQDGTATGNSIDVAMKLGTNYPHGPVEWARSIGLRQVQAVVASLQKAFGEDRYRVAPYLQQAALLGHFSGG
jgi:3-hydroxybutyryl-CoA dehydrogenase